MMKLTDLLGHARKEINKLMHKASREQHASSNEQSTSFCVIPWKHLHVCDTGLVRICCGAQWLCDDNGNPLTVYENSIDELWNSDHMRRVRRAMVLGGDIPECQSCWKVETSGGESRRRQENRNWNQGWVRLEGVSIDQLKADAIANDFFVKHRPFDLDIETTNTCNLKCRTCSAERSSKIEQDPIHSRWQGKHFVPVRWKNNVATFGATPVLGAMYQGFLPHAKQLDNRSRWTDGNGSITLPKFTDPIESIEITFASQMPVDHQVKVTLNGKTVYDGRPAVDGLAQEVFKNANETSDHITLGFESTTFQLSGDSPGVGVGVEKIEIKRVQPEGRRHNNILLTRLPNGKHWLKEHSFLYGELLNPPGDIRNLKLVGGEPLLVKETVNMIEYLANEGAPEKLVLSFTTNGTVFDDRFFKTASRFKKVVIAVSLDGVGKLFEYIRHGAKWSTVTENLRRFSEIENSIILISATFQAYNALAFTDLLRFCDQQGYKILFNILNYPSYLAAGILPPSARQLAAERLRTYARHEKTIQNKQQILSAATLLESAGSRIDMELLEKFMLFSNDLDTSRRESIGDVAPEILDHLKHSNISWSKKTVFA